MTPWLTELATIVSKAAPILGSALIGNYGAMALQLIQAVFGGTTPTETLGNVAADPDAAVKLKQIEDEHGSALAKLSEEDTMSARGMTGVETVRHWLMAVLIVFILLDTIAIYFVKDSQLSHLLIAIDGGLIIELKNIFKLYFGG